MIGLGTLINVACIVGGGTIGLLASSLVTERLQSALLRACGVCVIFVGAAGTLQHMLVATAAADGTITLGTQGTMTMLISLALGTVAGELLDLDARFETLGTWLRDKTGSSGNARFVDGFVTASLTVCIGAMASWAPSRTASRETGPRSPSRARSTRSSSAPWQHPWAGDVCSQPCPSRCCRVASRHSPRCCTPS